MLCCTSRAPARPWANKWEPPSDLTASTAAWKTSAVAPWRPRIRLKSLIVWSSSPSCKPRRSQVQGPGIVSGESQGPERALLPLRSPYRLREGHRGYGPRPLDPADQEPGHNLQHQGWGFQGRGQRSGKGCDHYRPRSADLRTDAGSGRAERTAG